MKRNAKERRQRDLRNDETTCGIIRVTLYCIDILVPQVWLLQRCAFLTLALVICHSLFTLGHMSHCSHMSHFLHLGSYVTLVIESYVTFASPLRVGPQLYIPWSSLL